MRTRLLLVVLGILGFGFLPQVHAAAAPIPAFQITGSGKLFHFESVSPGVKPPVTSVSAAVIAACITSVGAGCNSTNLETDSGGQAFIFLESTHKAWIATNNTCANPTEMEGLVGGDGSFMLAGHHDKSGTNFVLQGKVTFIGGTFSPTAIKKASIMAVSESLEHYAIGTFATVGTVFSVTGGSCHN